LIEPIDHVLDALLVFGLRLSEERVDGFWNLDRLALLALTNSLTWEDVGVRSLSQTGRLNVSPSTQPNDA
jgi:hypothetical protein